MIFSILSAREPTNRNCCSKPKTSPISWHSRSLSSRKPLCLLMISQLPKHLRCVRNCSTIITISLRLRNASISSTTRFNGENDILLQDLFSVYYLGLIYSAYRPLLKYHFRDTATYLSKIEFFFTSLSPLYLTPL